MSQFDDRQRGQEKKFELDEQARFKIANRTAKLVGLWAADLMGLSGDAAEAYAKSVVAADLEKPGHDDLIDKVAADFKEKNVTVERAQIATQMTIAGQKAREQIQQEVAA